MFSSLFNRKKEQFSDSNPADWSFLGTDIHSHLIPGIDDGAAEITDSLSMVKELIEMGYKQIITTPHIKFDHYKNTPDIILAGLAELKTNLKLNDIDIKINAAAEYFVDDVFIEMLESNKLLTIHKNEVLIEFSFMFEPVNLMNTIFKIQTHGYRPIIAHPERYIYFHQRPEIYSELKDRGCLLQLNALSAFGYYGKREQQLAEDLLEDELYDYCGTDMHHLKHAEVLKNCGNTKTFKLLKNYTFKNQFVNI